MITLIFQNPLPVIEVPTNGTYEFTEGPLLRKFLSAHSYTYICALWLHTHAQIYIRTCAHTQTYIHTHAPTLTSIGTLIYTKTHLQICHDNDSFICGYYCEKFDFCYKYIRNTMVLHIRLC